MNKHQLLVAAYTITIVLITLFIGDAKADTDAIANSNSAQLVEKWCKMAKQNETLCISTIKADPRETLKSDPKGFLVILIDAAKRDIDASLAYVEGLQKSAKDETTKRLLSYCHDRYEEANKYYLNELKLNKFDPESYKLNSYIMYYAGLLPHRCEEQFPDLSRPCPPQIPKGNRVIEAILKISSAVLDLIVKK